MQLSLFQREAWEATGAQRFLRIPDLSKRDEGYRRRLFERGDTWLSPDKGKEVGQVEKGVMTFPAGGTASEKLKGMRNFTLVKHKLYSPAVWWCRRTAGRKVRGHLRGQQISCWGAWPSFLIVMSLKSFKAGKAFHCNYLNLIYPLGLAGLNLAIHLLWENHSPNTRSRFLIR